MKIEIRKETGIMTLPVYSVYKNNELVFGTTSHDFEFTNKQYEMCVRAASVEPKVEVLKVFEFCSYAKAGSKCTLPVNSH